MVDDFVALRKVYPESFYDDCGVGGPSQLNVAGVLFDALEVLPWGKSKAVFGPENGVHLMW